MTTAQRVLDVARSQLGTVEARDGSTAYHRAYGLPFGQPWCAIYVWWCFRQAGAAGLIHPKTAYTPTLYQWFRDRGRAPATPQVGDLVFFDWPDQLRRIQHVGLVEAVEPGAIVTLEGNTSSGAAGSQDDGGGVWRRRRARNSTVAGYGRPAYSSPAPAPASQEDDMTPEQDRLLREVHAKLHGAHRTRVDYALLGERVPAAPYLDDVGGYAISADARSYETRQLTLALHRKVDALATKVTAGQTVPGELLEVESSPALTADDVRSLIREALADLGPLHLTAKEATS